MEGLVVDESWRSKDMQFGDEARIDWIKQCLAAIPNASRILDAGAGQLRYKELCKHLDYISQDFAQYDGKGNGIGVQKGTWDTSKIDIICDITNIPEPSESFDAILCIAVLEHIPNPIMALKEFSRLLKSGGKLILSAPFASATHFAPYHFYSGFTRYFYETHLPQNGFVIEHLAANGNIFSYMNTALSHLPVLMQHYAKYTLDESEQLALKKIKNLLNNSPESMDAKEHLNYGYQVLARKG